jgi:four helix bundle protein
MEENKKNIKERSFDFAVRVTKFVQKLPKNQASNKIGGQLLDAATSVGANVEEATGGFSKRDFTYKMGVALKEARESNYWLRLIKVSELANGAELDYFLKESEELRKILTSIVKTSKGYYTNLQPRIKNWAFRTSNCVSLNS